MMTHLASIPLTRPTSFPPHRAGPGINGAGLSVHFDGRFVCTTLPGFYNLIWDHRFTSPAAMKDMIIEHEMLIGDDAEKHS